MFKYLQVFLLILVLFFVTNCSSKKSGPYSKMNDLLEADEKIVEKRQNPHDDIVDENIVAPGYSFYISHPNDKDLNGSYRVNFDGILNLPYKIRIKAQGLSISELQSKVANTFKPFFSEGSPSVSFSLHEKKYHVEVGGLINKSGKYLIGKNTTFDELISMAQGISAETKTEYLHARVTQGDKQFDIDLNSYYRTGDMSQFPPWRGGDVIFIKKSGGSGVGGLASTAIKVLGEVRIPGEVPYLPGADIYYYLTKAGGQTNTVDTTKYELIRTVEHKKVSIIFNPMDINTVPHIESGDILHLHPFRETFTERVLRTMSYLGTIITAAAVLVIAL